MARPAITHATTSDDDDESTVIEGDAEDVTTLHDELDEQEAAIRAEFDGDGGRSNWRVKVYKLGERTGTRDWVLDCLPSDFPILARLRKEAGPGNYQAYCYKGRKLRILKWSIAPLLVSERAAPVADAGGPVLQAIAAQTQVMRDMLAALARQAMPVATPAAVNIPELISSVSQLMGALPRPAPAAGNGDPFALVSGVLTLVKDMQSSDREKSWVDIVESFFQSPIMEEMVKARMGQVPALPQQGPPQQRPPQPLPPRQPANQAQPQHQPQQQPQPQPTPEQQAADMALQQGAFFAQQLQFLMIGAQNNSDPQSYADVILDIVPAQLIDGLLATDDPFIELVKINPTIEPFRAWFDQVLACLTDDESQPDSPTHATRRDAAALGNSAGPGWNRGSASHAQGDEGEGAAGEGESDNPL